MTSLRSVAPALAYLVLAVACSSPPPAPVEDDASRAVRPWVTDEEQALLDEAARLAVDRPAAAEALLAESIGPMSSAVLDDALGSIRLQLDDAEGAIAAFERAVDKVPAFLGAWQHLGGGHVRAADYDAAIAAFERCIELGADEAEMYGIIGFAHAANQDFALAEETLRDALRLDADNTEWQVALARCLLRQSKFDDTAHLLSALLERYPDEGDFWLLHAQTLLGLQRTREAAESLQRAEELGVETIGLAEAEFTLGWMLAGGFGAQPDPEGGAAWLERSARRGLAAAQGQLGLMYMDGKGVERNEERAAKWLRRAATKGLGTAQANLGLLYVEGRGVAQSDEAALAWLERAARNGVTFAQGRLGTMYESGRGVEADAASAWAWYDLAAGEGTNDWAERRRIVGEALSPEELERARRLAEDRAAGATP